MLRTLRHGAVAYREVVQHERERESIQRDLKLDQQLQQDITDQHKEYAEARKCHVGIYCLGILQQQQSVG